MTQCAWQAREEGCPHRALEAPGSATQARDCYLERPPGLVKEWNGNKRCSVCLTMYGLVFCWDLVCTSGVSGSFILSYLFPSMSIVSLHESLIRPYNREASPKQGSCGSAELSLPLKRSQFLLLTHSKSKWSEV